MAKTFVKGCVLSLVSAVYAFAGGESDQITIWHQFYFDKGLDYTRFNELAQTRHQFRRVYVEEMAALMDRGATPVEAVAVLLALDDHYLDTLDSASSGLEASFGAEFRSALIAQYERINKPQRLVFSDGLYVANAAQNAQTAPPGVDIVASGTWSNINGNTVRISVDFVTVATGKMATFTAQGTIPQAAADLAFQLFDYYEKTRFPEAANPLSNLEVRPALPGHQGLQGVTYDVAKRACESQGYRLPYSYEMDLIYAAGAYLRGGIHVDPDWYYVVADDNDHVWLAPGKLECIAGMSKPNFKKRDFLYIMVKGTPSPKIQILTALDEYLKREYRKPEAARNTLSVYAVRLILGDLDANRRDSEDTRRVMLTEFDRLRIKPLTYLKHYGPANGVSLSPRLQVQLDSILSSS